MTEQELKQRVKQKVLVHFENHSNQSFNVTYIAGALVDLSNDDYSQNVAFA
jgi:hypothetical protein